MNTGELLTRWTVRLAVLLYGVSLLLRLSAKERAGRLTWARLAWTGGFVIFLVHVACAFEFYHHWSHRAAYEATARQSEEAVGLAWGGGLYANYAFALVWGSDLSWWWVNPESYESRSCGVEWAVQGFLAFIVFNATVVFGMGATRWVGAAGFLILAVALGWSAYRRREAHVETL